MLIHSNCHISFEYWLAFLFTTSAASATCFRFRLLAFLKLDGSTSLGAFHLGSSGEALAECWNICRHMLLSSSFSHRLHRYLLLLCLHVGSQVVKAIPLTWLDMLPGELIFCLQAHWFVPFDLLVEFSDSICEIYSIRPDSALELWPEEDRDLPCHLFLSTFVNKGLGDNCRNFEGTNPWEHLVVINWFIVMNQLHEHWILSPVLPYLILWEGHSSIWEQHLNFANQIIIGIGVVCWVVARTVGVLSTVDAVLYDDLKGALLTLWFQWVLFASLNRW